MVRKLSLLSSSLYFRGGGGGGGGALLSELYGIYYTATGARNVI